MRVRAAGALLLAPVLSIVDSVLGRFDVGLGSFADQAEDVFRALVWIPEGAEGSQPVAQAVARDVVLVVVVVVAVIGMAGLRAGRVLVPLAAIGLAGLYVPSLIWSVADPSLERPPDWVLDNQPWFFVGRASAVLWIVVLVIAALLAATSRTPARTAAAGPAGPAGPYQPGPDPRPSGPVTPPSHDPDRTLVQEEIRP